MTQDAGAGEHEHPAPLTEVDTVERQVVPDVVLDRQAPVTEVIRAARSRERAQVTRLAGDRVEVNEPLVDAVPERMGAQWAGTPVRDLADDERRQAQAAASAGVPAWSRPVRSPRGRSPGHPEMPGRLRRSERHPSPRKPQPWQSPGIDRAVRGEAVGAADCARTIRARTQGARSPSSAATERGSRRSRSLSVTRKASRRRCPWSRFIQYVTRRAGRAGHRTSSGSSTMPGRRGWKDRAVGVQDRLVGRVAELLEGGGLRVARVSEQAERLVCVRRDHHPVHPGELPGDVLDLDAVRVPGYVGDGVGRADIR